MKRLTSLCAMLIWFVGIPAALTILATGGRSEGLGPGLITDLPKATDLLIVLVGFAWLGWVFSVGYFVLGVWQLRRAGTTPGGLKTHRFTLIMSALSAIGVASLLVEASPASAAHQFDAAVESDGLPNSVEAVVAGGAASESGATDQRISPNKASLFRRLPDAAGQSDSTSLKAGSHFGKSRERVEQTAASDPVKMPPIDFDSLVVGLSGGAAASLIVRRLRNHRKFAQVSRPVGLTCLQDGELHRLELTLRNIAETSHRELVRSYFSWNGVNAPQCKATFLSVNDASLVVELIGESDESSRAGPSLETVDVQEVSETKAPRSSIASVVELSTGYFVNLSALGVFHISGDSESSEDLLRSWMFDLTCAPEQDQVDLRSSAKISAELDGLEAQSIGELYREVLPWLANIKVSRSARKDLGIQSASETEEISPMVIAVSAEDLESQVGKELYAIAQDPVAPLSLIVVGDTNLPYRFGVRCRGSSGTISHNGIVVQLCQMGVRIGELASRLIDSSVETSYQPYDATCVSDSDVGVISIDESSVLRVELLGEVRVSCDSITTALTPQQESLIVFLACNPAVTKGEIVEAIWNGQSVSDSRFANVLAEVRKKVGRHHLPEANDGRYGLAAFSTDVAEFEELLADGSDSSFSRVSALKTALNLCNGRPARTTGGRYWHWVEEHVGVCGRIESLVVDAAIEMADLCLEMGNYSDGLWAMNKGLKVSPYSETLVTLGLEAYIALDQRPKALRLVEEWELAVSKLGCGDPSQNLRKRLTKIRDPADK